MCTVQGRISSRPQQLGSARSRPKPTTTLCRPPARPFKLLQEYDSDFEGGEADALALKEAECWEPDTGRAQCGWVDAGRKAADAHGRTAAPAEAEQRWQGSSVLLTRPSNGNAQRSWRHLLAFPCPPHPPPNRHPTAACPAAVDADPTRSSSAAQAGDVISKLVGIYGSKELFISEYRWGGVARQVGTVALGRRVGAGVG